MSRKQIDLKRLKQNLQQIEVAPETIRVPGTIGRTDLERAYYLSAAVLITFDPWQLKPFGQPPNADRPALDQLLANCTLRYDAQGRPCWMLNHSTRKKALASLRTRKRLREALAITDKRSDDRLQTLFEAYVNGSAEPLAELSLTDLRHTLQIIDWLSETALARDLPSLGAVQACIAWEELMQPFHFLIRDGFYGREDVLTQFYEHVGAEIGLPPLLIFGPGGVGKSTVLAEFILRHTDRLVVTERLPFTYVDFDQAQIDPQEPLTILMLAARQLSVQYPVIAQQCNQFIEVWAYRLKSKAVRSDQNILVEQKIGRLESVTRLAGLKGKGLGTRGQYQQIESYILDFLYIYSQLNLSDRPWLFVLDTFEEVQLHSYDLIPVIGYFLEKLREHIPQARIIIAGRGEAEGMSLVSQELKGFDEVAALAFLQVQGVTHSAVARKIFQAVTGNPLSLKLAARIIKKENLSDEPDSAELRELLRKVTEGNIQGQLYRRVLDHITNPDVRKLAHPGLTLRFITPDLIKQVLAGPCEISKMKVVDGHYLFDQLSREITLVIPESPNLLRHRLDVRAVMITALHNDRPLVVHAIHKAAINYYKQRDGAEARAEEIYHRLFVEPDFAVIDTIWEPRFHETLERLLWPALYELTPRARAWLAARLQFSGVEDVNWDETDLPEWERYTEKRVRDRILSNDWTGALKLLGKRPERSVGSSLYFLETTILRQQERWEEARRCAYDGIYSLKMAKDDVSLLDLLRQAIAIDLHLGHIDQATVEIKQARSLLDAQTYPDEVVALEIEIFELKIALKQGDIAAETKEQLRHTVLQRFIQLSETELLSHPQLIQDVLEEFGNENNDVLRRGLRLMTFGELTDNDRETLTQAMVAWDKAFSHTLNEPPGVLLHSVNPSLSIEDGWQIYFQETRPDQITSDVEGLLEKYADETIRSTIVGFEPNVDKNISLSVETKGISIVGDVIKGAVLKKL